MVIHEMVYRLTLRKMTLVYRVFEFVLFLAALYLLFLLQFDSINGLVNAIKDFHATTWSLFGLQSLLDSSFAIVR